MASVNKVKIVVGIAAIVVVVMFVVVLLSIGGDDEPGSAGDNGEKSAEKGDDKSGDAGSGDEPALRTVEIKKSEGRNAVVNVGALIRKPGQIWLRVSAAPKQEINVNWTLACGVGATANGNYDVTPPDTRRLKLPKKSPKTCVASAGSQIDGNGRLKIAIMRDR